MTMVISNKQYIKIQKNYQNASINLFYVKVTPTFTGSLPEKRQILSCGTTTSLQWSYNN